VRGGRAVETGSSSPKTVVPLTVPLGYAAIRDVNDTAGSSR
jgi:hypothetical protein